MSCKLLILCTILVSLHHAYSTDTIPTITDDDFLKMTATDDYIIILFTKDDCKLCDTMENELEMVQGELTRALNAAIAKIYDSRLVHVYNEDKEPSLVFFRHGVPLLYIGEVNHELILHNFVENKEPTIKELSDRNFEHLTQASSGSTTGDWFIMFYKKACPLSRGMTASWEAIGAALRTKMNVARIEIDDIGFYTGKRFSIAYTPSFIMLHHGNTYKYKSGKFDVESLLGFARNFKQMPSIKTPVPAGPGSYIMHNLTKLLTGNDWFVETGLFGLILGLMGAVCVKYVDGKDEPEEEEEEEGTETDTTDTDTDPEHEKN